MSTITQKNWQTLLDMTNRLQDNVRKLADHLTIPHANQLLDTYNYKIRQDIVAADTGMQNGLPFLHRFEGESATSEYANRTATLAARLDTCLDLAIGWLMNKVGIPRIQSVKNVFPAEVYDSFPPDVKRVIEEAIGCYDANFLSASSVMLRKVLECSIHSKFKTEDSLDELFDKDGNVYSLRKRIELAKQKKWIAANLASELINIKWFGDVAAHNFTIQIRSEDLKRNMNLLRLVLEGMFGQQRT